MPHRPISSYQNTGTQDQSYIVHAYNMTVDLGSQAALDCYQQLLEREILSQAWSPSRTLMWDLYIYDDVHALFPNIEWERIFKANFPTCPMLTEEFLATRSEVNHRGNFSFHCFSMPHSIHIDQLCTFFHAPITNLSQPVVGFNKHNFWHSITGLNQYEASQSLQTSIVHLVLKLALKIICNIIYAQV